MLLSDRAPAVPESERRTKPGCPICPAQDSRFFGPGKDRLFGLARGTFDLYTCRSCRSVYQHPLPAEETLEAFYPEQYWWASNKGTVGGAARLLNRLEGVYRETVVLDHVRFLSRCARAANAGDRSLLDIGCGSGTFLRAARRRGFRAHGMDVSETAVRLARDHHGLAVRHGGIGGEAWKGYRFAFVTLFHVLEHLRDPLQGLLWADRLLAAGGSLIIQVPNVLSLQARIFGRRWFGLDVPRHLINFSPQALRHLLGRIGFEVRRVSRFSLRDNPASIASSLIPSLDPIGRRVRGGANAAWEAAARCIYFALFLAALPAAVLESAVGCGGTIWVEAKRARTTGPYS